VRLGDAFPVSCRRVSFGGEQRPSFVPRKRTSWNRSLSIRCVHTLDFFCRYIHEIGRLQMLVSPFWLHFSYQMSIHSAIIWGFL
jgi:hypothetical protein